MEPTDEVLNVVQEVLRGLLAGLVAGAGADAGRVAERIESFAANPQISPDARLLLLDLAEGAQMLAKPTTTRVPVR